MILGEVTTSITSNSSSRILSWEMRPFQDIQVNNLLRSIMCTILNEGGRLGVLKKFSGSWW